MNTLSPGEGCRLGSSLERVRVVDAQGRPRPGDFNQLHKLSCTKDPSWWVGRVSMWVKSLGKSW